MNFNSFKFKSAFVDAEKLRNLGFDWSIVIRMAFLGASFVREALFVVLSDRDTPPVLDQSHGYVDLLYSQLALSQDRADHLGLDSVVTFNRDSLPSDAIELIPEGSPQDGLPLREHFVIPGTRVTPLLMFQPSPSEMGVFDSVLFAGSFDHLHVGHKSVLTRAFFMTRKKLYVGLTSDALIVGKRCSAALEPYSVRLERVDSFIKKFRPSSASHIEVVFLMTEDSVGPAATLDFDALVVTPETTAGGEVVNNARSKAGHRLVEIVVVDILGKASIKNKLSSTGIREAICAKLPGGETQLIALQSAFHAMLDRCGASNEKARKWWSYIRDAYGLKPWKHYHTLCHISELLELVELEYGQAAPLELLLSVWFHDVVYDPRSSSNEKDSVHLLEAFVEDCGISEQADITSVKEAIVATSSHITALSKLETNVPSWMPVFLEMDLAILCSPDARYDEYAAQIRREYSFVSESDFNTRRAEFLRSMEDFRFRWLSGKDGLNERLHLNITRELSILGMP